MRPHPPTREGDSMTRIERLTKWERAILRAKAAPVGRKWIARARVYAEAHRKLAAEARAMKRAAS